MFLLILMYRESRMLVWSEQNGRPSTAINWAQRLCVCSHIALLFFDFCSLWCLSGWLGGALPKVMSCLAAGLWADPASLGAALSIGWRCDGLRQRHGGCQSAHTHTHTRAYQSWPQQHRECLPTSLPVCLPAGGERPGLERTGTINCAPWCLSCSFMLSLSMCSLGTGVCARHVYCLIRGKKIHVAFRWRFVKGCFGVHHLI